MKFITLSSLALLAASVFAQDKPNCGGLCDRNKTPSSVLSGNIDLIAVVDKDDSNIRYKVGGTVVVENDCSFRVENFYLDPQPKDATWHCVGPNNSGIAISKEIVNAVNPDAPQTFTYDVEKTDLFCHAALIDDCTEYVLMDKNWQTIGRAVIGNSGSSSSSSSGSSSSSSGSSSGSSSSGTGSNSGSTTGSTSSGSTTGSTNSSNGATIGKVTTTNTNTSNNNKTSDATTSKWSIALLGLSSLAAFLLA